MMHTKVVLLASQLVFCLSSYKDSPVSGSQFVVDIQRPSDKIEVQGHPQLESGSAKSEIVGERVASKEKDVEKPIPLETKDGNPVQISLIITNRAKPVEPKSGDANTDAQKKKETTPHQKLSEMLLKPNPITKSNSLGKDDILAMIRFNNEIKNTGMKLQKMSESSNKILKKSINFTDAAAQEDLVNYHVIEITENKNK